MIEMLVVVLIIMMVSTIGINTYQNQRRQVQYNDAILKVVTLIKTARNYAITSRSTYDTCKVGNETYVPAEGYGIFIKRSPDAGQARFVLFANTQANTDIEKNQFDETSDPCVGSDRIEEEFELNGMAVLTDLLTSIAPLAIPFESKYNADENEAVIIFKTSLAETTIAANDHPPIADDLSLPVDLYLQFERPTGTAGNYTYIHINRLAGFPEIETP